MRQWSRHRLGLTAGCAVAASVAAAAVCSDWPSAMLVAGLGTLSCFAMVRRLQADQPIVRASGHTLPNFVEQSLVGLYVVQDGKIVYANNKTAELLGVDSPEQLLGAPIDTLVHPDDMPMLQETQRRRLAGEIENIRYTFRAIRRDGGQLWIDVHGSICEYEGRPALMGVALDVSQREGFERQSRLSNHVFEFASEGIVITDAEGRIDAVNPAFTRITGYTASESVGKLSHFMSSGQNDTVNQGMLAYLAREGQWQGEIRDRHKNGRWYPAWLSVSVVKDPAGKITNYVGVFADNTSRKEAEMRLRFLASHDSLTGMVNRSAFMDRFATAIGRAQEQGSELALLFIDLDRFKNVNDTLGHQAGDQLLVAAAARLQRQIKGGDLAARLGGDEFIVLLEDAKTNGSAGALAERLIQSLAQPFAFDGQEMFVTASIGIACYPAHGTDAVTLMKHADVAMYRAKERGRNTFQYFTNDMNAQSFERLMLENNLRHALERSEFELHYQPQFATADGRVAGLEALIRWRRAGAELVAPGSFIPLAEQNGLIVPIGAWVLQEACRQGKEWLDAGWNFGRIAVNLSARQFASDNLLDTIHAALESSGLPPAMLELEITESTVMQNPADAVTLLNRIREMGVALSIDDFGTGYSSLAMLKQYPLDSLKIDRSFVQGIPHDSDDVAITETIIAVAHKMQLQVVAEGVETQEQANFLRTAGCDTAQGFLMSRPVPASAIKELYIVKQESV